MSNKSWEFTVFVCGHFRIDKAWNVAIPYYSTVSNPNPEHIFWKLPYVCVLLRHPDIGNYMFDTGVSLWDKENRTPLQQEAFPHWIDRDEFVDKQLEKVGLTVDDIDGIILSHMHWDHADGLDFFTGHKAIQNVYVNRTELADALIYSHGGPEYNENDPMYRKIVLDLPDIKYHFINEDTELFPGLKLITLPGHTRGSMGMVLECEKHTYIFTGDALNCQENYGPPAKAPGIVQDTAAFFRSTEKVRKIQKNTNAVLFFGHNPDLERDWELAPRFYR